MPDAVSTAHDEEDVTQEQTWLLVRRTGHG